MTGWPAVGDTVITRRYSVMGRVVHERKVVVEKRTKSTVTTATGESYRMTSVGWTKRPRYLDYTEILTEATDA